MRNVYNALRGVACILLACTASSAQALDTREVVVEQSDGIVEVPRHLGQVLATPNRSFSLVPSDTSAQWSVHRRYERLGKFSDHSAYLRDPQNLFYQTTYFEFNEDRPIGAEIVAKRLSHQLGTLTDEGIHYVVVGHADEVGSDSYNMALSIRRAQAVVDLLVAAGHAKGAFQVLGRGKLDPISFSDQSLNRRVEVVVKGTEKAQKAYKDMRSKVGGVTCRNCIAPTAPKTTSAPTPSAEVVNGGVRGGGETRQPTLPTVAPGEKGGKDASATVRALEKMSISAEQIAAGGAPAQSFRADQNPPGSNSQTEGDAFNQILNPTPFVIPETSPIGSQ